MPYRRDYIAHSGEFVEREAEITQIIDWAQNSNKRVLIVTGLPGIGKTWLLEKISPLLKNPHNKNTLWINVPKPEEISSWLEERLAEIRPDYPNVPLYDPLVQPGVLLKKMMTVLCNECNGDFYLIFDKGDELFRNNDRDDWREFERIVIEPSASLPCIRFIVALHDKQRIQTPILRRSSAELALEGFKKEGTGLAHIRLLLPYAENPLPGVTAERVYGEYLQEYGWEHPCLNAYLVCECLTLEDGNLTPNFGQPEFLPEVLEALLNNLPPNVPQTIDLLTQIALFTKGEAPPFWTPGDLQEICGLSNTEAWEKIEEWRVYQLIVEEEGGRFGIQESLYELLLAAADFGR